MTRADYFFLAGPAILFLLWLFYPWYIILTKGFDYLMDNDETFTEYIANISFIIQVVIAVVGLGSGILLVVEYIGRFIYHWINSF